MKKDKEITEVTFRKWRKEIIALFPYIIEDYNGIFCSSYMHIGQHSSADYSLIINHSKLATEEEYKDLKEELESIGYNLKVIKKRNYDKYLHTRTEYLKKLQTL